MKAAAMMLTLALGAGVAVATQDVVRTGDPYARGYTDDDFPRIQELAEGVYSYEQLRSAGEEKFTTVSLFVITSEGVLVADGQGNVDETQRMIDEIAKITDQPITHLVICSDHGDHTGGNSTFPEDITIWAHPTSAAVLEASAARRASGGRGGRGGRGDRGGGGGRRGNAAPIRVPNSLVEETEILTLGDKEIVLMFLGRAHTGGDLSVYLPAEKILFMSEAYLNRIFPAMRSAYPSEWVAMIGRAQELDVETYVPGHGFVDSPEILAEELENYRQAMVQVIDEAKRLHALGLSADQAVEQAQFGDLESWTIRSSQGPTAIRRIYLELNDELPGQVPGNPRLNPIIELLVQGKPVFGVYAPRNPRSRGRRGRGAVAPPQAPTRTPTDLAEEAIGYEATDFLFDGSMEGGLERALPAFSAFAEAWAQAGALDPDPSPRLTHPLIVKSPELGPDVAADIHQQLNLGVSGIMFPQVESAEQLGEALAAMRFSSNGGTRPDDDLGAAPARWRLSDEEYRRKADLWPLNPDGELINWTIIESHEGLANVREIAAVPGIGVLWPGAGTLRGVFSSTNANGQRVVDQAAWEAAIQQVLAACVEFDVPCGFPAGPDNIEMRMEQGFSVFVMSWGDAGFRTIEIGRRLSDRAGMDR